jgi:copper chaperone CopZ
LAAVFLSACAGSPGATTGGGDKADMDQGTVHTASAEETKYLGSTEPVQNNTIVLYANGLGCPQCASNIDLQINKRVPGAQNVYVDLALGTATVDITPGTKKRLSPKQYHDIVGDAGFTLVKMTSR